MVVGIGNYILQDEGVGVHVINHLRELDLPPRVSLVDGGTHSYDLVDFFCQADTVIVIDAIKAGGEPGTLYRAPLEDLGLKADDNCTSLHQMHFIEAVQMVNLLGYHPQIIVYGVEPQVIDWGMELTPDVAARVPRLAELIKEEIEILAADS
jgi:hydrogenase maturation protease